MKKVFFTIFLVLGSLSSIQAQVYEYKIITSVESIIQSGAGRSRILDSNEDRDYKDFASNKTAKSGKNKSKRGDIRIEEYEETKLLNFFNLGGIRFQNIVANDAVITSKINALSNEGWELTFISSAVESDGGETDGKGIFLTRYIFKRLRK